MCLYYLISGSAKLDVFQENGHHDCGPGKETYLALAVLLAECCLILKHSKTLNRHGKKSQLIC